MADPELPRAYVDTASVPPIGTTLTVPAGGDFQAALDAAQPWDVISLQAGATFTAPAEEGFTLPAKAGTGWITIRTSTADAQLPPEGTRISPSFAPLMAKLVGPYLSAVRALPGAHHYRFVGIEFAPPAGIEAQALVALGWIETSLDEVPHHIILDRCYVHGDPAKGGVRGVLFHGAHLAVIDSYLSDWKDLGQDTQAVAGWNGPGPFKVVNNYLEGAGETVMFGGAMPTISGLVPADIEIRGNFFRKPLNWRIGDPTYAGKAWIVKNHLELKNAERVLVEGNVFEDHWAHAQSGWFLMITPRSEEGLAPWVRVSDVTFRHNVVRRSTAGIAISGSDGMSQRGARIAIRDNVFEDLGVYPVAGANVGDFLMFANGVTDVTVDHNTVPLNPGSAFLFVGLELGTLDRLVATNNIIGAGAYGIFGDGVGAGSAALAAYAPDAVMSRNALVGPYPTVGGVTPDLLPPENYVPNVIKDVGLERVELRDYRLSATSPYRTAATDGRDVGADIAAIQLATAGALTPFSAPDTLHFSEAVYAVRETEGTVTIMVVRDRPLPRSVSVRYTTRKGTATPSKDYSNVSGTLTFAAGVVSKTFTVRVIKTTATEEPESVILALSKPTGGAVIGEPLVAVLVITD